MIESAIIKNKEFEDNEERTIFFTRGVLETVKKLRWAPDIVHCHGWFTGLVPLYLKKAFNDDPLFCDAKVVYSVYEDDFKKQLNSSFKSKLINYILQTFDNFLSLSSLFSRVNQLILSQHFTK